MPIEQGHRTGRPPDPKLDVAILQSALDLLAEVGFQALTVTEVARRAGSTTPAIYRRFADKTKLVQAALAHELATITDLDSDQGSLRHDLIAWVATISAGLTPRRTRIMVGLLSASGDGRELVDDLRTWAQQASVQGWSSVIHRALARGEVVNDAAPVELSRIPAALIMTRALLREPPLETHDITSIVDTVLLPALRAASTPEIASASTLTPLHKGATP